MITPQGAGVIPWFDRLTTNGAVMTNPFVLSLSKDALPSPKPRPPFVLSLSKDAPPIARNPAS